MRKQIDRRFHTPLHVAGVVLKLARARLGVKAKAILTIPIFVTMLFASRRGGNSQVVRQAGPVRRVAPVTSRLVPKWATNLGKKFNLHDRLVTEGIGKDRNTAGKPQTETLGYRLKVR